MSGPQNPFGSCPRTGTNDGYRNIGAEQWFYGVTGKTKWLGGRNLFSSWKHEDENVWQENQQFLAGFDEVDPIEV